MDIKTKYNVGDEVYLFDFHCAGRIPAKGRVLSFKVESLAPDHIEIIYGVKLKGWIEKEAVAEEFLFDSLSELKKEMVRQFDVACMTLEEDNQ